MNDCKATDWNLFSFDKTVNKITKIYSCQNVNHCADDKWAISQTTNFRLLNPLPNDKILDWSKLKQIEANILKCTWNLK